MHLKIFNVYQFIIDLACHALTAIDWKLNRKYYSFSGSVIVQLNAEHIFIKVEGKINFQ